MDTLSVDNLINAFLNSYTKGLERGSDIDWTFREVEIHNKAHKLLDKRLEEAKETARTKEANEGCNSCNKCDECCK